MFWTQMVGLLVALDVESGVKSRVKRSLVFFALSKRTN